MLEYYVVETNVWFEKTIVVSGSYDYCQGYVSGAIHYGDGETSVEVMSREQYQKLQEH